MISLQAALIEMICFLLATTSSSQFYFGSCHIATSLRSEELSVIFASSSSSVNEIKTRKISHEWLIDLKVKPKVRQEMGRVRSSNAHVNIWSNWKFLISRTTTASKIVWSCSLVEMIKSLSYNNFSSTAGDCKFININLLTKYQQKGLRHKSSCKQDATNCSQSFRARFSESGVSLFVLLLRFWYFVLILCDLCPEHDIYYDTVHH